jgi:hypothetical protein
MKRAPGTFLRASSIRRAEIAKPVTSNGPSEQRSDDLRCVHISVH